MRTFLLIFVCLSGEINAFWSIYNGARKIQVKSSSTAEENFSKPPNGGDRIYDLRFPSFVPMTNLPQAEFNPHPKTGVDGILSILQNIVGNTSSNPNLALAYKYQKLEERVAEDVPFPCPLNGTRSKERPKRADRVRPGDIDVIAAFGDSLTAGNGLVATHLLQVVQSNRGLSWIGGGQSTWRQFITLPNIIKEMNPNLVGYATGDSIFSQQYQHQQLNLGEPGAVVDDLPVMAQMFVHRLKRDPRINFTEDWKLVSMMIGAVDLCLDVCFWTNPQNAPGYFKRVYARTIDYLYKNSPRTIVNLILPPHIPRFFRAMKLPASCVIGSDEACTCVKGLSFQSLQGQYDQLMDKILDVQQSIADDEKYKQKPDFRVIGHSVLRNWTLPLHRPVKGSPYTDDRYLSADCFHISQRSQSLGARMLWNSMMTPAKERKASENIEEPIDLICPTQQSPYIRT